MNYTYFKYLDAVNDWVGAPLTEADIKLIVQCYESAVALPDVIKLVSYERSKAANDELMRKHLN